MSGIRQPRLLFDFYWTFNLTIPLEKIMEFIHTDWLEKPCNLDLLHIIVQLIKLVFLSKDNGLPSILPQEQAACIRGSCAA